MESQQSALVAHLSSTWLHAAVEAQDPDTQKPVQQSMPEEQLLPFAAQPADSVAMGRYTPDDAS